MLLGSKPACKPCQAPQLAQGPVLGSVRPCRRDTGSCQHRDRVLQPCRVTNTSEEIYRGVGLTPPDGDHEELYQSNLQVHNPELGILENRVGRFFLEELFQDSGVDLEETAYWFHTPPGGWNTKPLPTVPAEEAPVTFPEPQHIEDLEGRISLDEVEEDTIITGTITDCWLYHGIQVDFGAEYDGLVHINDKVWMERGVREHLMPGDIVQARIHKLRQPGLYRWPVQMELVEPAEIAALLDPPETYVPPINHEWCSEQGWGVDEICAATGRTFQPSHYYIMPEHKTLSEGMEMAFGHDDPEANFYIDDPMEAFIEGEEGQLLINDAVNSVML